MQDIFLPFWIAIAMLSLAVCLVAFLLFLTYRKWRLSSAELEMRREEAERRSVIAAQHRQEWQALFDLTPEGLVIQQAGYVVSGNSAFAYMLGIESVDLVGADLLRMLAREDRELFSVTLKSLQSGLEAHKIKIRLRTVLGDLRPVVASMHKWRYEGRDCELIFFSDVANKEVDPQTTQRDLNFAAIIDALDGMVGIFDMHGVLQWGNPSWRSFWGVANGMEAGVYALFQDTNYAQNELKKALVRVVSGSNVRVHGVHLSSPKGQSRMLDIRFVPVFEQHSSNSLQCGFALIQKDIGEELRLKGELAVSSNEFDRCKTRIRELVEKQNDIFDSLPGVLVILSSLGIVIYWNNEAEAHFDILRSHALGQPATILASHFPDLDDKIDSVLAEQSTMNLKAPNGDMAILCPCESGRMVILRMFSRSFFESF